MLARINTLSIITVAILLLCSTPVFTDAAAMQGKIGVITPLTGDMAQNGLTAKVGDGYCLAGISNSFIRIHRWNWS